jgi:signal peptidase I
LKESNGGGIWELIKTIFIALVLAIGIRTFLFTPVLVDGISMMPTLQDQSRMIVNKIVYKLHEPERFDIVVFHATKEKDYIKRVIGLPGDTVEYKNDVLYVNGKAYKESYLNEYKKETTDGPLTEDFKLEEITGKKTVPKGQVFVLGDNRRLSKDSRIIGTVSQKEILGRASFVFWPLSEVEMAK